MNAAGLRELLLRAAEAGGQLQEIRIRTGFPVMIYMEGREWYLLEDGGVEETGRVDGRRGSRKSRQGLSAEPVFAGRSLVREILELASRHSLYAYEEEIRQGFLTIEGGHRIGLAGKAVLDGDQIRTLKDISALNIRLAHEKPGCADRVLPWLYKDGILQNTLFLSPPGAGKTTMLRDVIRQVSNGNPYGAGQSVSVVDERSELAACFRGIPQCDLGVRTDVLDNCPKIQGMLMMLRSMAPRVIAVDEIGTPEDLRALQDVMKCGCRILATVHGDSVEDLKQKPVLSGLAKAGMFTRYVVLSGIPHPGILKGIYKEDMECLDGERYEE